MLTTRSLDRTKQHSLYSVIILADVVSGIKKIIEFLHRMITAINIFNDEYRQSYLDSCNPSEIFIAQIVTDSSSITV